MAIAMHAFAGKKSLRSALRTFAGGHDCGGRALPTENANVETLAQWIREAGGQVDRRMRVRMPPRMHEQEPESNEGVENETASPPPMTSLSHDVQDSDHNGDDNLPRELRFDLGQLTLDDDESDDEVDGDRRLLLEVLERRTEEANAMQSLLTEVTESLQRAMQPMPARVTVASRPSARARCS